MTAKIRTFIFIFFGIGQPLFAGMIYQNFEPNNGTPASYSEPIGSPPQYGWQFNGTVVGLSQEGDPVYSGKYSWQLTVPAGEHLAGGSGIAAQVQTYNINFVPQCHDRLTFWIWSNPSKIGDHTVMVKFFDHGRYHADGIGIWTTQKAQYQEWTQLSLMFNLLPVDFDLEHVDKIEFFNYWDGTYYYDDIEVRSDFPPEKDLECLKKEVIIVCPADTTSPSHDVTLKSILGVSQEYASCVTTFGEHGQIAVDYLRQRNNRNAAFSNSERK